MRRIRRRIHEGSELTAPSISAIVLGYDRKEFIREAVDSALGQTVPPNDVVVTKTFADPVIDSNPRLNVLMARERLGETILDAAREAKGDWLAFLDDDDIWDPRKLQHVSQRLSWDASLSYYNHGFREFRQNGGLPPWSVSPPLGHDTYGGAIGVPGHPSMRLFLKRWPGNDSSIVIRRDALLRQSDYLRRIGACVDTFLLWAAYLDENHVLLEERTPLTNVRIHDGNYSRTRRSFGEYVPRYRRSVIEHEFSMNILWAMVTQGVKTRAGDHRVALRSVDQKLNEFRQLELMLQQDARASTIARYALVHPTIGSLGSLGLYAIHPKLAVAANYANALVRW